MNELPKTTRLQSPTLGFSHTSSGASFTLAVWAAAALLGLSPAIAPAADPAYQELRDYQDAAGNTVQVKKMTGREKAQFNSILSRGATAGAAEEQLVDDFLRSTIFEMTWKENVASLPVKRDELKKALRRAGSAAVQDMHRRINDTLLAEMPKIAANENFNPAARINCMLVIASLNEQEADAAANVPGAPLAAALPVLEQTLANNGLPDYVRVPALRGLIRHIRGTPSADIRTRLTQDMVALIKIKQPAAGKAKDGHVWLRMLATEALRELAQKGQEANQPEVAAGLVDMLDEPETLLTVRCEVANTIGHLASNSFTAELADATALKLGEMVVEISKNSTKNASPAAIPPRPAPPDPDKNAPPKDAEKADPPDAKVGNNEAVKPTGTKGMNVEELTYHLYCTRIALSGAGANRGLRGATSNEASRKFVDDLSIKIDEMLKISSNSRLAPGELASSIDTKRRELEQWLKDQLGPAQPANAAGPKGRGGAVQPATTASGAEEAVGFKR